jgi:hypothetical protein
MATGTVSIHSWTDGAPDDEGEPRMGSNYNARLDARDDFDSSRILESGRLRSRNANGRGGLRSRVVRPNRLGQDADDGDDTPHVPGEW